MEAGRTPINVDPFSALYFLVDDRHSDDQRCYDHGHAAVSARPTSESLPASFLRALDGHGARDCDGREFRKRFMDDVWGDFVGYDGLRHIRPRRERTSDGLLLSRDVSMIVRSGFPTHRSVISIAEAICVDRRGGHGASVSCDHRQNRKKPTFLHCRIPKLSIGQKNRTPELRRGEPAATRRRASVGQRAVPSHPRWPISPKGLVVEQPCWPRNQTSQLPAKLVVTDTLRDSARRSGHDVDGRDDGRPTKSGRLTSGGGTHATFTCRIGDRFDCRPVAMLGTR